MMHGRRNHANGRPGPDAPDTAAAVLATLLLFALPAACVKPRCYEDADCSPPDICLANGQCGAECRVAADCGTGFECSRGRCVPKQTPVAVTCPDDMVAVGSAFCVDRYEASRPDATSTSTGTDKSCAESRAGVLPWEVVSNAAARTACQAAGKDLCTPQQWKAACEGSSRTAYGYGDTYEPKTCNGIDLFGRTAFHLLPTGALPECQSDWGVFDINGNLWEHVLDGSDTTVRGGAYNCSDSRTLHRCDYVPGNWSPSARGFRCCLVPNGNGADVSYSVEELSVGAADAECLDDDTGADSGEAPNATPPGKGGDGGTGPDTGGTGPGGGQSGDSNATGDDADGSSAGGAASGGVSPGGAGNSGTDAAGTTAGRTNAEVAAAGGTSSGGASTGGTGLAAGECPEDMVAAGNACMDRWEASHTDATESTQGASPVAASQPGVLPWSPATLSQARDACSAAGKRLCDLDEWVQECRGPTGTVYSYGDQYDPAVCNGIDTYCYCGANSACADAAQCPFPHCRVQADGSGVGPCGAAFHVMPTGSFPDCVNHAGAFDVTGNVWELTDSTDGLEHFRGGAYNCGDSEALHRCDHDGTWGPSARGFRCCKDRT